MMTEFNCVEMKHRGSEKIQKKTAGLSAADELKFWQEQTSRLQTRKRNLLKKKKASSINFDKLLSD